MLGKNGCPRIPFFRHWHLQPGPSTVLSKFVTAVASFYRRGVPEKQLMRSTSICEVFNTLHATMGVEDTPFMFRMTPKAHYIWHQAVQTRQWRINPFLFHCFGEESWLGKIKCIAKQCHGRTMTSRIIARYLICLALYLENHRRRSKDIASNG